MAKVKKVGVELLVLGIFCLIMTVFSFYLVREVDYYKNYPNVSGLFLRNTTKGDIKVAWRLVENPSPRWIGGITLKPGQNYIAFENKEDLKNLRTSPIQHNRAMDPGVKLVPAR